MKTFEQYYDDSIRLVEGPIPPDWDQETFGVKATFAKQLKYAMERAAKIGTGSSRVAFEIPYGGRPTILKIAKNKKGLAQNKMEADYGLYNMYPDVTVPLIDYDEVNFPPRWIHFEKAEKMKQRDFERLTGLNWDSFRYLLINDEDRRNGRQQRFDVPDHHKKAILDSELFYDVTSLMGNFDILANDLGSLSNWGIYQNRPVIIDLGFSSEVQAKHYNRESVNHITEGSQKIISFDFDCTLADTQKTPDGKYAKDENKKLIVNGIRPGMQDKVNFYHSVGYQIYIVTARPDNESNRMEVLDFVKKYKLPIHKIIFTSFRPKWQYLKKLKNLESHYDDDEKEIEGINTMIGGKRGIKV